MRRRHTTPADGTIDEALLAVFIGGWSALTLQHDTRAIALEWALDDQLFRAVWLKHRPAALAEIRRRGITEPIWAQKKFDDGGGHAA